MRTPSIVWHAVNAWLLWRAKRRLYRAVPALAVLDQQRAEKRRRHASGARQIDMRKRALVTERLMHELGRV